MKISDAIDVVVSRRGNVYEWDHELLEAAEFLASEVAVMRKILNEEALNREKRWVEQKCQYTQGRLHEAMEIKNRFSIR